MFEELAFVSGVRFSGGHEGADNSAVAGDAGARLGVRTPPRGTGERMSSLPTARSATVDFDSVVAKAGVTTG
jgi:hypothetical protein